MVEGGRSERERDVASRLESAFVKRRMSIGYNSASWSNRTLGKVFLARTRLYGYAPEARSLLISRLQKCSPILRTWSSWYIIVCIYMESMAYFYDILYI